MDFEVLGQIQSHELVPNGTEKRVDDSNKEEYLRLMTDWRFSRGLEPLLKFFFNFLKQYNRSRRTNKSFSRWI